MQHVGTLGVSIQREYPDSDHWEMYAFKLENLWLVQEAGLEGGPGSAPINYCQTQ